MRCEDFAHHNIFNLVVDFYDLLIPLDKILMGLKICSGYSP